MGHEKREYKIVDAATGGAPKGTPALADENGNVIAPSPPNQPEQRLIFNKHTDNMRKVDHYRIRFDIKDFKNSTLRFVPNRDDVFWVQEGTECPTNRCGLPGVIWVDDVDKGGEWIDVINMDLAKLDFQFTLNFVDKTITNPTQADYVDLDPGGGNEDQGGGGSGFTVSYAAIAVGTVAFAAFTAYGFGLLESGFIPTRAYVMVAVGTLAFAAFAAYLSGLFER